MAEHPLLSVRTAPTEENSNAENRMSQHYHGDTQPTFDHKYGRHPRDHHPLKTYFSQLQKNCMCSKPWLIGRLRQHLPIIDLITTYQFKEYILGDVLAGISVGVLVIPQGLGYALLADLPPIVGLYTSFFPVLVYLIFGRSRHISIGTMALTSLIIASAVAKAMPQLEATFGEYGNVTTTNPSVNESGLNISSPLVEPDARQLIDQEKISIAMSMSFVSGIILVIMSMLKLGMIATYISDPFMGGYICGANIQVLTHQFKHMLGLTVPGYSGTLGYFYMLRDIILSIPRTNIATLVTSIIATTVLFVIKKFVNERYARKLKVPIPIDTIVVIIATMISHFCNFEERFEMTIVKEIPQGLPRPAMPPVKYMKEFVFESFVLALINYMILFMMVKMFSQRHGDYAYDADQEMLATGLTGLLGSFFSSMASSTSPSRCIIGEQTGGSTQFAQLISAIIVLLTLLFFAPLLEALPICILASLIVVSCVPLFKYYVVFIEYWRTSKHDFAVWTITTFGTLLFGIEAGILIGVSASIVMVVLRTQRPYSSTIVIVTPDNKLLDETKYNLDGARTGFGHQSESIKIFKFDAPLHFANLDLFKDKLFEATVKPSALPENTADIDVNLNIDVNKSAMDIIDIPITLEATSDHAETDTANTPLTNLKVSQDKAEPSTNGSHHLQCIILDLSAVSFVDTSGAKLVSGLHRHYKAVAISLVLASMTETVRNTFYRVKECASLLEEGVVYPSVLDALINLRSSFK